MVTMRDFNGACLSKTLENSQLYLILIPWMSNHIEVLYGTTQVFSGLSKYQNLVCMAN